MIASSDVRRPPSILPMNPLPSPMTSPCRQSSPWDGRISTVGRAFVAATRSRGWLIRRSPPSATSYTVPIMDGDTTSAKVPHTQPFFSEATFFERYRSLTTSSSANNDEPLFFRYKLGIDVPQDVTHVCIDPSVAFIPAADFRDRRQLKEVVLPEGLQGIGLQAFFDCRSLERINVPSTLTVIGYAAFSNCHSLTEVDLPGGLQEIGEYAFYDCRSLERINFPSTLTAIGPYAFGYCTSLTELNLPEGLQGIGEYAFYDCTSLERIHFPSTLTAIGESAFDECTSLTELNLRKGIQDIGKEAFHHCTALGRIHFPSTLTDIRDRAFDHCISLSEVKLVGGIQDIGARAFQGCSSLERIMIPSRAFVIEIGPNHNCRALTDGTMSPMNLGQVMIASNKCLKPMSVTGLTEVENTINGIINDRERTREENLERIRAFLELINCGFDMNIIISHILPFL